MSDRLGGKALAIECDVTCIDSLLAAQEKVLSVFGSVDVLINNAAIDAKVDSEGLISKGKFEELPLEQWNLELSVGLTGAFLACKVFGSQMCIQNTGGVVLNI